MVEISTSILSVEKENIIKTIYNLETAKTDYFHIDVMDGVFVENNTVKKMMEYCGYLNTITSIPLDIHLMVEDVQKYIDMFLVYNPNIITIHIEAIHDKNELLKIIEYIKSNNCKVGISLKPSTDISSILDILENVHVVLVMTVRPGKGGQRIITDTVERIKQLSNYIKQHNLDVIIEADGGINTENIKLIKDAGAEIIVSGTGIVNSDNFKTTIEIMKKA